MEVTGSPARRNLGIFSLYLLSQIISLYDYVRNPISSSRSHVYSRLKLAPVPMRHNFFGSFS